MPTEIISFDTGKFIPENNILVIRSVMAPICQKLLELFPLTEEDELAFKHLSDWSLGLMYDENRRHLFEKLLFVCDLNIKETAYKVRQSDIEKYGPLMYEYGWGWVHQKQALKPAFKDLHTDENRDRRDYFCTLRLKNFLEAGLARYG